MRVTLVTSFNAAWQLGRTPSPYVPLNLLCLAAGLRNEGHEVSILDQSMALRDGQVASGPDFDAQICGCIEATAPDVVGLTTMCNSYPQSLLLARRYRERAPHVKLVLGGPQATVVDSASLTTFPWIDAIVRGEADVSFPSLVGLWQRQEPLDGLPGITWRDSEGRVRRNPDAQLQLDLDQLPVPAYDLYPLDKAGVELIPIEAGRGCPYGCTFCSTNVFFNRRYRIKTPARLIDEMRQLHARGQWTRFDLVHDMLTVDRRWISAFCDAMRADGNGFEWGCSARIDRVDPALLAEMRQAGCTGIFFGIETGSQRLQSIIKKNLKMTQVLPILQACVDNGIKATSSCITGYPEETTEDAMDSFNHVLDVVAMSTKTRAQMHMLAPLVGSPLYEQHRDELEFDGHSSDISSYLLNDDEAELVRRYRDVFPNFYYIPTPHVDRDLLKVISAVTYSCHVLFIALRRAGADLRRVLEGFVAWRKAHVAQRSLDPDYYNRDFGRDMCRYLREQVVATLRHDVPYLMDLVSYYELRYSLQRRHVTQATVYAEYDYAVDRLIRSLRSATWETQPESTGLLFVNLSPGEERGFAFLEVRIPRSATPLIRPGDDLEVRDPARQLRTREHLIIRNNTTRQVFATRHHMTSQGLQALGLAPA